MSGRTEDEYPGPLLPQDVRKREKLEKRLFASAVAITVLAICFLALGIGLLAKFGHLVSRSNGAGIFGIVALCLGVPLAIVGGCLINIMVLVKAAIEEAGRRRIFKPEELRDVDYPKQPQDFGPPIYGRQQSVASAAPPPLPQEVRASAPRRSAVSRPPAPLPPSAPPVSPPSFSPPPYSDGGRAPYPTEED
ncbi:unnamed protein product [Calicophoron daubneyi]|uniref:Uncharacterized protein n=1 Tax=Calicophoron daubneyi TaxID=300641 RepID=A0AAV2TC34_CALDB